MSEIFHIGDEVQYILTLEDGRTLSPRFVITSFSRDGLLNGIGKNGIAFCDKNPSRWRKTGRHFVEAEELMKALGTDNDPDISGVEELLNYALYLGQRVHGMNTETLLLIGRALEQTRELKKVVSHE